MHHPGFIRAIIENPDEDSHRLIYADWLEDHNQPERAEHIRAECRLAQWDTEGGDKADPDTNPVCRNLRDRATALWFKHGPQWVDPGCARFLGSMGTARGFPHYVCLGSRQFLRHAESLFCAEPTFSSAIIDRLGQNANGLAQCPALSKLRSLDFTQTPVRAIDLEYLAQSPYLTNLQYLDISYVTAQVGPRGAIALAGARSLTNLTWLDMHHHQIRDEGLRAILRSNSFLNLAGLQVAGNGLTNISVRAISRAIHLDLRALDLSENNISGIDLHHLTRRSHLKALRALSLNYARLSTTGAEALAKATFLPSLQKLSLTGCNIDDNGMAKLLGAQMPQLREGAFGYNRIGTASMHALAGNQSLSSLRDLKLPGCGLQGNAMEQLGRAKLPALRSLDLGQNRIGEQGIKTLLNSEILSTLTQLDLQFADLLDGGITALAQSTAVRELRDLNLSGNGISSSGATALATSQQLVNLSHLDLTESSLSEASRKMLTDRFGDSVRL